MQVCPGPAPLAMPVGAAVRGTDPFASNRIPRCGSCGAVPPLPKVAGMQPASIPYTPAAQEVSRERTWMQTEAAAPPMPTPSLPREGMQGSQAAGPVQTFPQTAEG